jgi:uncharacterized membrane protein YphA (DoxX/SURF4 family)
VDNRKKFYKFSYRRLVFDFGCGKMSVPIKKRFTTLNTMSNKGFRFGLFTVILIVILRVAIGWHYFYEGIHKFDPEADFSAKGFLGVAKGPTAPLYYAMLPDITGTKRLELGNVEDAKGKEVKTFVVYEKAWNEFYAKFKAKHSLDEAQQKEAQKVFDHYIASLRGGAANVATDVEGFKKSLERYNEMKATQPNDAEFEQVRRWDAMMKYRGEAGTWLNMLDGMGNSLQSSLAQVVSPQLQGERGKIITTPEKTMIPNPCVPAQMRALDLAVMCGLSAIGLCMMIGFCNRLACLGGAVFLVNVVLTTYPVPGVYPPLPTAVGNFLFVSKDVVELIAMLFLASIPAGRWGGLDYFLWHCGGKKIAAKFGLGEDA